MSVVSRLSEVLNLNTLSWLNLVVRNGFVFHQKDGTGHASGTSPRHLYLPLMLGKRCWFGPSQARHMHAIRRSDMAETGRYRFDCHQSWFLECGAKRPKTNSATFIPFDKTLRSYHGSVGLHCSLGLVANLVDSRSLDLSGSRLKCRRLCFVALDKVRMVEDSWLVSLRAERRHQFVYVVRAVQHL